MPKINAHMNRDSFIGVFIALLVTFFVVFLEKKETKTTQKSVEDAHKQHFTALYGTPVINGLADDAIWQTAQWLPLDQVWLGAPPTPADFSGRYKLAWDENNLYILAEITDDSLTDTHADGLVRYWDDDCLEIFLDEDASGGIHQYNYNAFAYHVALDGRVVDVEPDQSRAYYNDHCTTRRTTSGKTTIWEVAVTVFDGNKFVYGGENVPKSLRTGKRMGFALAYCDNDRSVERENFIGNVVVEGQDKDKGWIDAGIFGLLTLQQ